MNMPEGFGRDPENTLGRYILRRGRPIPEPDLFRWAEWMETHHRQRRIDCSFIGSFMVSTAFLGLNHNVLGRNPPILFETMIFYYRTGASCYMLENYQTRCCTVRGARRMHRMAKLVVHKMVRELEKGCETLSTLTQCKLGRRDATAGGAGNTPAAME